MDMEQVFLRLHLRSVAALTRIMGPTARAVVERLLLLGALAQFLLLIYLHATVVSPAAYPSCLSERLETQWAAKSDCDVMRINVESSWSRALRDLPDWLHEKATHPAPPSPAGPAAAPGVPHGDRPARELHAAEVSAAGSFYHLLKSLADDAEEEPRAPPAAAAPTAPPDQAAGMRSNITAPAAAAGIVREGSEDEDAVMGLFWAHAMGYVALLEELSEQDPVFYFSKHRSLLMLPESLYSRFNVTAVNVTLRSDDSCSGPLWLRLLLEDMLGFDTLVLNALIHAFNGTGHALVAHSQEIHNLNYAAELRASATEWVSGAAYKLGVLVTTVFLFFTTSTLVSFTLRETQERMLKFTLLLQHRIRNRLPYGPLVLTHVVESLVFVPIMCGILFFLFEFFGDQLLAFMVMTMVWAAELFSAISLRTEASLKYFPRVFLMLFFLFHCYFFCYPFGFYYLAFFATAATLQFFMLFFWRRFEVPALQAGFISPARPRATSLGVLTLAAVNFVAVGPLLPGALLVHSPAPSPLMHQDAGDGAGVAHAPLAAAGAAAAGAHAATDASEARSRVLGAEPHGNDGEANGDSDDDGDDDDDDDDSDGLAHVSAHRASYRAGAARFS